MVSPAMIYLNKPSWNISNEANNDFFRCYCSDFEFDSPWASGFGVSKRGKNSINIVIHIILLNLKMLSPALLQTMKDYDPMRADMSNIETTLGWFTMTFIVS